MLLMKGLINILLNTLAIGFAAFLFFAYNWSWNVILAEYKDEPIFERGVLYVFLTFIIVSLAFLAAPINYSLYMLASFINITSNYVTKED